MKYDYHIHTFYCKHSDLTVNEIVQEYFKNNFIEIGISDHIPYKGDLDSKDNSRMYYKELESYINDIKIEQEKYQNKLKINIGFESEFFSSQIQWYKELLSRKEVDYLILGIHAVENLDEENNFNRNCTNKEQLKRYWKAINEGMRSGLFAYAVHPDFYMKSYQEWDDECDELANKICDLANELDFPLGFNINGIWKGPRQIGKVFRNKYPIHEFWKIAKKKNVKIILESDVHHKKQLYDTEIISKTYSLIKEWGLEEQLVSKLDLEKYKKNLNIKYNLGK
ncbi:histidinol-phosphatase [Mycoplasmopsis anatis]|uniref:Histidinol-phosphatase n=1 Tax=Mycoplasmopsis anatis 1340 TaxID=1034808 RepID=F9QCE5_9BACT|nr:histidinol-phosphatase [Mycoplasmopsis anatis]EGS29578.1 histidinol phosphate phosphatase HisJ family protein [Mycoplasmopsis anatis 1340]VEU73632.1 histidinol-phosphatase [Mycoplasmopsis anatis]